VAQGLHCLEKPAGKYQIYMLRYCPLEQENHLVTIECCNAAFSTNFQEIPAWSLDPEAE